MRAIIICLFIGWMLPTTLWSQDYHTISGDGRFIANISYNERDNVTGQHTYKASVYSVAYKSLIKAFDIRYDKNSGIDSLRLSESGKMLFVKSGDDSRIYNTRLGSMVFRTDQGLQFAMANQDNFFVVSAPNFVKSFDAYTGEELTDYRTAPNNQIRELVVTSDDEHLAAITYRKQIMFWQVGKERARKKFFGDDIVFKQTGKGFTIARKVGPNLSIYNYDLPTFKRINKLSISSVLRDDARERTIALRESDPSQKRAIINPSIAVGDGFLLSQVGNYVAILAKNPNDEKELYVIQTNSGAVKMREVVGEMRQNIALNWYNDSLLIPQNAASPRVYNASRNAFEDNLKLKFLYSRGKGLFAKRKDWDYKNISANYRWAVSQKDGGFDISKTNNGASPKYFNGLEFIGFSSDGRFAYCRSSATKFFADLTGVNDANGIKWIPFSEEERLYPEPEMGNVKAPSDYQFVRMKELKHISEAGPDDTLRLIMKTIETGSKAGVQVQLIDQNGVYYYGAGTGQYKNIWCNLMVKGSDGKVRQIDDFTVTEYSEKDSLPNAVAAVMDFSGSMGWPRADALQDGVEKFLNAKKEKDEIALFKYDHRVVQESELQDKKEK